MKRLWLFFFPLLFMPNAGFSHRTDFGVLEVCDWLIAPFIVLLMIAPSAKYEQRVAKLNPLLWSFLVWALLSTLSIHFRYEYLDDVPILIGSCLKLARLVLFVMAGVLIARKLGDPKARGEWLWSLLAALLMLSMGLLANSGDPNAQPTDVLEGYKSYNAIVVSVAILCSYIAGLWIDSGGSRRWRQCASVTIAFAVCSVFISSSLSSHGRGGWLAFAAGFGYILLKRTQTLKTLVIIFIVGLVCITAYEILPNFRSVVDLTLSASDDATLQSVDDGSRISTWVHEGPKLVNAPLLGTGFYHRAGASGLWETGSHNFFLQMFLETGVVGGGLLILIFALTWRQAGLTAMSRNKISVSTRAALITAIVGGMSGEYFYGGVSVLVVFAAFAMAGALPTVEVVFMTGKRGSQFYRWRQVAS
ncbi:MAG TPA: O-antigen ligase family protein [Terriglobales bacterium]|nr:O-antigen ligase family protein [Terriglobales bacterium]